MKNFLILTTLVVSLATTSFAKAESEQIVNPGEDPNLTMTPQGADVAAHGTGCKECLARLKGGRLQDPTAAGPRSASKTPGGTESSQGNKGVQ